MSDNNKEEEKEDRPCPPKVATPGEVVVVAAAAAVNTASSSSSNSNNSRSPSIAEALYAVETLVQIFGFSPDVANQAVNEVGIDVTECYNYILDQNLGTDTGGAIYPIDNCPHIQSVVVLPPTTTTPTTTSTNVGPNLLIPDKIFDEACQYHHFDDDHHHHHHHPSDSPRKKQGNLKEVYDDEDDTTPSTQQHPRCPMGENWWCLTCHRVFCSRYVNGHGLQHWKDTKEHHGDEQKGIRTQKEYPGHCIAVSLADLSVWCHQCGAYLVHDETVLKPIILRLEQLKFPGEDST